MQLPAGSLASACAVHAAGRKSGRPNADVNWAIATLSVSTICLTRRNIEELTAGRVGETIARFNQSLGRTPRAHGHAVAMSGSRPTLPSPPSALDGSYRGINCSSSPPILHTKEHSRIVTACGDQYENIPDHILKSQTPPHIKDHAHGVKRARLPPAILILARRATLGGV